LGAEVKAELRLHAHTVLPDTNVVEVWFAGSLIATVTGADGPGVRIISKYPLALNVVAPDRATPLHVVEVTV
jgi:hypothetical protein